MDQESTPDKPEPQPEASELQFDRAAPAQEAPATAERTGVACSVCRRQLHDFYYALGTDPVCATCKDTVVGAEQRTARWPVFFAALGAGFVAALLGAALYYAVIAITNFEIGLVAIAIGFMVGWAIRKVTRGFGRRRYQVLGVALTYLSVGMAYMPLAYKGIKEQENPGATTTAIADSAATADTSVSVPRDVAIPPPGSARSESAGILVGVAALLGLSLALPVLAIVGSMPTGLISALIIFFGMQQAWRMSGRPPLAITGPYTVGSAPPAA